MYFPSDSQETGLEIYTQVFSLDVEMVEILADLYKKWKWGSENIRPL